jgi:hypothetical protein
MTSKKAFYSTATVQHLITNERNPSDTSEDPKSFPRSSGLMVTPSRYVPNRVDITGYVLTAYDNYGKAVWAPSSGGGGGGGGGSVPAGTRKGAVQIRNVDGSSLDAYDGFYWENNILNVPGKITNLSTPTENNDAATKLYVDSIALAGVSWKDSVRFTTTGNVNLGLFGSNSGIGVINGLDTTLSVVENDRVLLKDQINPVQNGIYVVANNMQNWKRSFDFALNIKASGAAVFVTEGTNFNDKGFVCVSDSAVVGNALSWSLFTSTTLYPGGNEDGDIQYKSGNVFAGSVSLRWLNSTLTVAGSVSSNSINLNKNNNSVTLSASDTSTSYSIKLPPTAGTDRDVLTTNGSGVLSWGKPGSNYGVSRVGSGYNGGNPFVPSISDDIILVTGTTTNDIFIQLPNISDVGKIHYNIFDAGNADLHSITIRINPMNNTDKIYFFNDNTGPITEFVLSARYNSVQLINDGQNYWYVY